MGRLEEPAPLEGGENASIGINLTGSAGRDNPRKLVGDRSPDSARPSPTSGRIIRKSCHDL